MPSELPANLYKSKNRTTAGLLAIFLGAFGLHKFYLGYNQAGFVMMAVSIMGGILSFGLATAVMQVIAFVEAGVYLTRTQEAFDDLYVAHSREWF